MVVCIGEILVDLIGETRSGVVSYRRCAGGAPFNVSCAAKKTGGVSGFVGRVGNDPFGRFLIGFAKDIGHDYLDVKCDPAANTTAAVVQLDENGERSFGFLRHGCADYKIDPEQIKKAVSVADTVCLGTLMLSEPEGIERADAVLELVKKSGKRLCLDVNYREDIFKDIEAATVVYRKYIEAADIAKFSEEELDMFYEGTFEQKLLKAQAGGKLVCVTLGARGSAYAFRDRIFYVDSIKVDCVDTTGAGDAFFGCLVGSLDGKDISGMSEEELKALFHRANICGALTTMRYGAIDAIPTEEEIEKYLSE